MGQAATKTAMTAADYLAWEAAQTERHEFVGGETFAMAGAEDRHVTVTMNIAFALRQHLSGSPCRTYMSDMRLSVAAAGSYFYPDVMVTCSSADQARNDGVSEPCLVVEVLSDSTAFFDRGDKFETYKKLASLQTYVLVSAERKTMEVFTRGGHWQLQTAVDGAVQLGVMGLVLNASEVFDRV